MASKETEECRNSEKERESAGRLVYDVLLCTLPKCGLPETMIPPTDCEANVYESSEFLNIIGGHVVGISLALRDGLKRAFQSRKNKNELNDDDDILAFLPQAFCCFGVASENSVSFKTAVIRALAVCNEIVLFLYTEGVSFDINIVIQLTAHVFYLATKKFKVNLLKALQEKFLPTDTRLVDMYFIWLYDFMERFHITYRSMDVSDIFREEFMKPITAYLISDDFQVVRTVEEVKEFLGFLPCDFSSVKRKDPPEAADTALGSILTHQLELPEPATSSANSVSAAVEKEELRGGHRPYRQMPGQTAQKKHTSKSTFELGIEDDLEKMNLGVERASQETQGAIPKRGRPLKKDR